MPAPHFCPAAHCPSLLQTQVPFVQVPLAPHWVAFEQVPHVPPTQAIPPPHWLLSVQAAQRPLMHTSPMGADAPP
jgi:hypothetical protein